MHDRIPCAPVWGAWDAQFSPHSMRRFGPDPRTFFDSVYEPPAPWDIGTRQPALTELLTQFPPADPILDIGCGPGDRRLRSRRRGTASPASTSHPEQSPLRARDERASPRTCAIGSTSAWQTPFTLRRPTTPWARSSIRVSCTSSIGTKRKPPSTCWLAGSAPGRYYLLAFAVTFDIPNAPRAMSEEDVRSLFGDEKGWQVRACRPAELLSRIAPVPATAACIERPWGNRPGFDPAFGRPT